jgi:hypothetical protein
MKLQLLKLAAASALLSVAATAHAATNTDVDTWFTLQWDVNPNRYYLKTSDLGNGNYQGISGNTVFNGGHSGGEIWDSHEMSRPNKLCWGDPSCLELIDEDGGYVLKHTNSSQVESQGTWSLKSTNLLLNYTFRLADGTFYDANKSFAVTFNETRVGNDVYTMQAFAFTDLLEIKGEQYQVSFFSDKPSTRYPYEDFQSYGPGLVGFDTPENGYSYLHFTMNVQHIGAVPEPETYAMLLAGLGIVGLVARRRRNMSPE